MEQRIIKFKGKSDNGQWYYGYLTTDSYNHLFIESVSGTSVYTSKVKKETVGQFTGLSDKNGKEIYGGDILKSFHFKNVNGKDEFLYHKIIWSEKLTGWQCVSSGQTGQEHNGNPQLWVYVKNTQFEVCGNLYDTQ